MPYTKQVGNGTWISAEKEINFFLFRECDYLNADDPGVFAII